MSTSLQLFNAELIIDNYHDDFLILKSIPASETRRIGKAIFQRQFDFAAEVIVTEVEICIKLNKHFDASKIALLKNMEQSLSSSLQSYQLPIYFNEHEDWMGVQASTGLDKQQIIAKLIATDFSIAMFGFLPGFIYLDGLAPALQVPRKTIPAKYVKANSIAIGGKYLGLYALGSPGGWHVIGQMPIPILQLPELPPVLLNPGDHIRLEPIDQSTYQKLLEQPISLKEYNA